MPRSVLRPAITSCLITDLAPKRGTLIRAPQRLAVARPVNRHTHLGVHIVFVHCGGPVDIRVGTLYFCAVVRRPGVLIGVLHGCGYVHFAACSGPCSARSPFSSQIVFYLSFWGIR